MTPVIGITTYEDQASWRGWSARAAMLPYVYVDAVRRSGGRAVLLAPGGGDEEGAARGGGRAAAGAVLLPRGGEDEEAAAPVASLDGLLVTGGPDIDPVRYGAARHPRTQAPPHPPDAGGLSGTRHAPRPRRA